MIPKTKTLKDMKLEKMHFFIFVLLVTRIANTDTCELGNQLLTCTYPGLIRSNYESPFICLFKDNLFCQKLYYDA